MTIKEVLERTNWKYLAQRKLALLHVLNVAEHEDFTTNDEDQRLRGLLEWIDALQDAADSEGYPVVFLSAEP